MTEEKLEADEADAENADVVFECPHCGKSLACDVRGIGMTVTCVDCGREVEVPVPEEVVEETVVMSPAEGPLLGPNEDPLEKIQALTSSLAFAQDKINRLVENLEEVRERRAYLEKLRTENLARFDRITGELSVIQAAMDRVVGALADARAERPGDTA